MRNEKIPEIQNCLLNVFKDFNREYKEKKAKIVGEIRGKLLEKEQEINKFFLRFFQGTSCYQKKKNLWGTCQCCSFEQGLILRNT